MKRFLKHIFLTISILIFLALSISIYNIAFANEESAEDESELEVLKETEDDLVGAGFGGWFNEASYYHHGAGGNPTTPSGLGGHNEVASIISKCNASQAFTVLTTDKSVYCLKHHNALKNKKYNFKVYYGGTKGKNLKKLKTPYRTSGWNSDGSGGTNIFTYATAFSNDLGTKSSSNYEGERAQKAIWNLTNDESSKTNLYKAASAVDYFYKNYSTGKYSKIITDKAETTIKTKDGIKYFKVGKFSMNDYVLLYSDNVASYSGSKLKKGTKKLVAGITDMEITLLKEDGSVVKTINFKDCKISYIEKGNLATATDSNIGLRAPSSSEYKFPRPNSEFYLYIPVDENAVKAKLSVTYRKTTSSGKGWVIADTKKKLQPLLVVYNTDVTVKNGTYETGNVRLTTHVTIDKYITKVVKKDNTVSYNNTTGRKNKAKEWKENNPVKVETGDIVTFKIVLTNQQNIGVKVAVKDVINLKHGEIKEIKLGNEKLKKTKKGQIKISPDDKIKISKNSTRTLTVKVIVKKKSGVGKNTARLISRNKGKVSVDQNSIDFVRRTSDGKAVANMAELDSTCKLSDSDYFEIPDYKVSVNKRIVEVKHINNEQSINIGDSRKTKSEAQKSKQPVYAEYGDRIKYEIELKNDSTSNYKVYANLEDYLPDGYSDLKIKISNTDTRTTMSSIKSTDVKIPEKIQLIFGDGIVEDTSSEEIEASDESLEYGEDTIDDGDGVYDTDAIENDDNNTIEDDDVEGSTEIDNSEETEEEDSNEVDETFDDNSLEDEDANDLIIPSDTTSTDDALSSDDDGEGGEEILENTLEDSDDDDYDEVIDVPEEEIEPDADEDTVDYTADDDGSIVVDLDDDGTTISEDIDNLPEDDAEVVAGEAVHGSSVIDTSRSHTIKINNIVIPKNGTTKVTISFVIEGKNTNKKYKNSAKITKVRNSNSIEMKNNSTKKTSRDYYKINDYKLSVNKYISGYGEEITKINNDTTRQITSETNVFADRSDKDDTYKKEHPLFVEQGETVVYSIKVENNAVASVGGRKYATDVKPLNIKDTLGSGLSYVDYDATLYRKQSSGSFTSTNIKSKVSATVKDSNKYYFHINDAAIILKPGDYIIYNLKVKVNSNNFNTNIIPNTSSIQTLVNINHRDNERHRGVTEINKSTQQTSKDYLKMKDLVIAGKVWLDLDKDGYIGKNKSGNLNSYIDCSSNPSTNISTPADNSEYAMKGIVVKLYNADNPTVAMRTTKTDNDGLFTFARDIDGNWYDGNYNCDTLKESQQRISRANNYYIEYEYDGLIYKSTEVYSNKSNLNSDGTMNTKARFMRDSNAAEFETIRETFNNKYEIVGYNYAAEGTNTNKVDLEYEKNNHASYLRYDKNRIMTSRTFITNPSTTEYLWKFNEIANIDKPETEYLKYINLGLSQRETADISVVQDVYKVRNVVNGEEMTYEYNQNKYATDGYHPDDSYKISGSKVDFKEQPITDDFTQIYYMTGFKNDNSPLTPYTFKYYLSDYNYKVDSYSSAAVRNYKTEESELNSEISFRIKVTNNINDTDEPHLSGDKKDVKVYTGIDEVIEYFDDDFMNITYNSDGSVNTIYIKTKDENGYLKSTPLKVAEAYYANKDGTKTYVTLTNSSLYYEKTNRTISGYNTVYIRPIDKKIILAEGENLDIIIKFIVDKTSERNIKKGLKTAIAEIGGYSTYYDAEGNEPAGLIDEDSNPSNFGDTFDGIGFDASENNEKDDPSEKVDPYLKYYEDDTYKTGINLESEDNNERRIEGQVWDDARCETVLDDDHIPDNGIQYIGDGKNGKVEDIINNPANEKARINEVFEDKHKEKNDFLVGDVGVKLVELVRMPGDKSEGEPDEKIYEETIVVNPYNKTIMETRTGTGTDEGKYLLKGYIPGEYAVKFFYGDKNSDQMLIFNGQDYKSTTYQNCIGEKDGAENTINDYADNIDDTDTVLDILETKGLSDAKDDEIRRLEVISYSETLNNNSTNILRGKKSINPEAQINNTNMKAETADFLVRAEKEKKNTTALEYSKTMEKFDVSKKRHPIENIDFGLQYRPEQQIVLNKYVKNVKIITSDNNPENAEPLVDAKFNEYYGVVADTNFQTGVTTFVTYKDENGEDVLLKVNKDASASEIEAEMSKHGINFRVSGENIYKVNGKYQVIVAGTELDTENSIGISNLQYVPNSKDSHDKDSIQGFVYLNIDDQIMQGAEIKIEYLFTGHNISEIDRVNNNLSSLRFKNNETVKGYEEYLGNSTLTNKYSGAKTARNSLYEKYYKTDKDDGAVYRQKQYTIGTSTNDYYGSYMGLAYYTGKIDKDADVVSELKFDKILDYADNKLVFKQDENNSKEGTWIKTTTQELLNQQYIDAGIPVDGHLVDKNHVAYDTPEKSNLALLQDFRTSDTNNNIANADITKYLLPRNSEAKDSFGMVKFLVSKVISAEDDTKDMDFENIGEILEYSSVTGRVTNLATTIGDVNLSTKAEYEAGKEKSDTGAAEEVTLTPPTGLYKRSKVYKAVVKGASYGGITIAIAAIATLGTLGGIKIYRKRRIK